MTGPARCRIEIGIRCRYDGKNFVVSELLPTAHGTDVLLSALTSVVRLSLVTLVEGIRAQIIPTTTGLSSTDELDPASVILASLTAGLTRESASAVTTSGKCSAATARAAPN